MLGNSAFVLIRFPSGFFSLGTMNAVNDAMASPGVLVPALFTFRLLLSLPPDKSTKFPTTLFVSLLTHTFCHSYGGLWYAIEAI